MRSDLNSHLRFLLVREFFQDSFDGLSRLGENDWKNRLIEALLNGLDLDESVFVTRLFLDFLDLLGDRSIETGKILYCI